MEAKEIVFSDWILSGGGSQGESYFNKSDKDVVLKLYHKGFPIQDIENEINLSEAVIACGVSCPGSGTLVRCGERYGIIFRRIRNKKSFCRAMADDPLCIEDMAGRLALMGRELHSKSSIGTPFVKSVDFYNDLMPYAKHLSEDEQRIMNKCLSLAREQDCDTLLHGDFHYGNVITDGEHDYFIDLGAFSCGNPLFDISMLYFVTHCSPEEVEMDLFHITVATAAKFWDAFKPIYFAPDCPSEEDIYIRLIPYLLLRCLFMIRDVGTEHIRPFVRQFSEDFKNYYE